MRLLLTLCLLLLLIQPALPEVKNLHAGYLVSDVTSTLTLPETTTTTIKNVLDIRSSKTTVALLVRDTNDKNYLLVYKSGVTAAVDETFLESGFLAKPLGSNPGLSNTSFYKCDFGLSERNLYFTSLKQNINPKAPTWYDNAVSWRLRDFRVLEKVVSAGETVPILPKGPGTTGGSGKVVYLSAVYPNFASTRELIYLALDISGNMAYFLCELKDGKFYALFQHAYSVDIESRGHTKHDKRLLFEGESAMVFVSGAGLGPGFVNRYDLVTNEVKALLPAGGPIFGDVPGWLDQCVYPDLGTGKFYYAYFMYGTAWPWLQKLAFWTGQDFSLSYRIEDPIQGFTQPQAMAFFAASSDIKLLGLFNSYEPYPYQDQPFHTQAMAAWDKTQNRWTGILKEGDEMPGGKRIDKFGQWFVALTGEAYFFTIKGGRNGVFDSLYRIYPAPPPPKAVVVHSLVTSTLQKAQDRRTFSPGELVTAFGDSFCGLATQSPTTANVAPGPDGTTATVHLPPVLASSRVLLDGQPVPLYFAWSSPTGYSQINFQVPNGTTLGEHSLVFQRLKSGTDTVEVSSDPLTIQISAATTWFFGDYSANGLGPFIQNVTRDPTGATFVSATAPAQGGDIVILWPTGLGQTTPLLPSGEGSGRGPLSWVNAPVQVLLEDPGRPGFWLKTPDDFQVVYTVANPSFAGLYQLAIRIPSGVSAGKGRMVTRVGASENAIDIYLR